MSAFRDRIREVRTVMGRDIHPSPYNWKTHPISQRRALRQVLEEVGIAGIPVCYEQDGKLFALDGHCRLNEVGANQQWKVAVLDISPEEAKKLIAVYDPISELAEPDQEELRALFKGIQFDTPDLNNLLVDIAADNGVVVDWLDQEESLDNLVKPKRTRRERFVITIECDTEAQRTELLARFGVEPDRKKYHATEIRA